MFKKTIAAACIAAIAAVPALPAAAQSFQVQVGTGVQQQMDDDRDWRDRDRRDRDWRDGRFERRGDRAYFNGHRGFRDRRDGYRQYNGYWFPSFAFSFQVNSDEPRGRVQVRLSERHINWCEDRYRSYRASDNTFQPNRGPRKQCVSPYFG